MPYLTTPASYLTLAQLKADDTLDLTKKDGTTPIGDPTLSDLLEETSGQIDAMIRQSFLPQEETIELIGEGTNFLAVGRYPLIYVRQVKIVLPNAVGFDVPTQSLLVDYASGTLQNMTPLVFQGYGITTLFPQGVPIHVTCAWGVNYAVPPPTFTAVAAPATTAPLSAGPHTIQVTTRTYSGESLPGATQTVTLGAPGSIATTVTNAPGGLRYIVYLDGLAAAELVSMSIGTAKIGITVDASIPPIDAAGLYNLDGTRRTPPTVDTSAAPLQGRYAALRTAQKMLIQSRVWEMKNKSNQGIAQRRSGNTEVRYRDNTRSTFAQDLDQLLSALTFQGC